MPPSSAVVKIGTAVSLLLLYAFLAWKGTALLFIFVCRDIPLETPKYRWQDNVTWNRI